MYLMVTAEKKGISYNLPLLNRRSLTCISAGETTIVPVDSLMPDWETMLKISQGTEEGERFFWQIVESQEEADQLITSGEFPPVDEPEPEPIKPPQEPLPEPTEELILVTEVSGVEESLEPTPEVVPEPEQLEAELPVEEAPVVEEAPEEVVEEESAEAYTEEYLRSLSMTELRVIGKELGQKNRSFDGLVEEILGAQAAQAAE